MISDAWERRPQKLGKEGRYFSAQKVKV